MTSAEAVTATSDIPRRLQVVLVMAYSQIFVLQMGLACLIWLGADHAAIWPHLAGVVAGVLSIAAGFALPAPKAKGAAFVVAWLFLLAGVLTGLAMVVWQ